MTLLAHSSEKWGERGPSKLPMGSSQIRFGPRWWCYVGRAKGDMVAEFDGNEGTPYQMRLSEPDGKPSFEVRGDVIDLGAKRRERGQRRDQIVRFVAEHRSEVTTQRELADMIEAEFGGKASTHKVNLSRGAYGGSDVAS